MRNRILPLVISVIAFFIIGCQQAQEYDIVIKGARVVDPESGLDAISNIGITGAVITAVTTSDINGKHIIDAQGLIAAPGFIDYHAHGQDSYSEKIGVLDGKTSQLDLEAGALPVSSYYDYKKGRSISNYGASVGHAFARVQVLDGIDSQGIGLLNHTLVKTAKTGNRWASVIADDDQLDQIDSLVIEGIKEGGLGIGVMTGYYPKARSDGIARIAKIAQQYKTILTTHSRYISLSQPSGMLGIQEMISLATSHHVPLLVHHVPTNALADTRAVLEIIDAANSNGAVIVGEMFPYDKGSTYIGTEILSDGWQDRMDMDYQDLTWVESGEVLTEETFNRYRNERPDGFFIMNHIKEKDMMTALVHPSIIIGSDGMVFMDNKGDLLPPDSPFGVGQGHPRGAGSYGTYLRMAIDDGRLSMPQILAKTSYLPAQLLETIVPSMMKRGRLQVNAYADITLFDPERVNGAAGYELGTNSLPSEGFVYVLVNGELVVKGGELVSDVFPGKPIRSEISTKL